MRIVFASLLFLYPLICAPTIRGDTSVRPSGRSPACIIDIDKTITDPRFQRRTAKKVPMPHSAEILRKLASRGVAIFYLSRRQIYKLEATKWWMDQNDFPPGAGIYLCDREEEKVAFKTRIIRTVQKDYDVLFGVGDQSADMEAYGNCGIAALLIDGSSDWLTADRRIQEIVDATAMGGPSEPDVSKRSFVARGRSPYLVLEPGFRMVLEGKGKRLTITVLNETKRIADVDTRVIEEREEEAGKVTEISRNYYALCANTKDVFYFGEDVDVYSNGRIVSHSGSWQVGEGEAKASLLLPAQPKPGMKYFMEESPGQVMDRAEILSVGETATTPAGKFAGCLGIRERSELQSGEDEIQVYASGIGMIQQNDLSLVEYGFGEKKK